MRKTHIHAHHLVKDLFFSASCIFLSTIFKKELSSFYFSYFLILHCSAHLKGLSHEIDIKNFDKNLQNLT
jgi:hypothetical protein